MREMSASVVPAISAERAGGTAFAENPDDLGGQIGFHQLGIGVGRPRIRKWIVAPAHELQPVLTHRSSCTRLMRSRTRSISCFGVPIPALDFF